MECQGLMLSDEGYMQAIPELHSKYSEVELTHEAAVGKIAREEIEYLMARGLPEETATSLIVKGFLSVKIEGLSKELQSQIDKNLRISKTGFLMNPKPWLAKIIPYPPGKSLEEIKRELALKRTYI